MFQRRGFGIVRVIERGVYFKGWAKGQGKRSECVTKGVSTRRRRGEGMQLSYILYRGRNAGGY